MFFSPLEQFLVIPLGDFGGVTLQGNLVHFVLSNITLVMFWLCLVFVVLGKLFIKKTSLLFSFIVLWHGYFYSFLVNLARENIIKQSFYFLNFLYALFCFLLLANLCGMVPYSFALTSHLAVTLLLSFISFFGSLMLGCQIHGLTFLRLFLPHGSPFFLAPFLILIEFISYTARLFSLAIRLFANIMSGHTLLKILAGFGWILFIDINSILTAVPTTVVFIITGLELIIAMLQGYVFSILTTIYSNESIQLH